MILLASVSRATLQKRRADFIAQARTLCRGLQALLQVERTKTDESRAPEAGGPDDYALDVATGAMAKDGAAGNQYAFSSGGLITGYTPTVEGTPTGVCTTAQGSNYCGDFDYAEVVFDHIVPYARPLWTYDDKVVGSYISGRHSPDEANIKWNAMFWGFGLEGVGKGGNDTVGRTKLPGDVFSFLTGRMLTPPKVYLPWAAKSFVLAGGDQP